jgi:hypothetical protein
MEHNDAIHLYIIYSLYSTVSPYHHHHYYLKKRETIYSFSLVEELSVGRVIKQSNTDLRQHLIVFHNVNTRTFILLLLLMIIPLPLQSPSEHQGCYRR